MNFKDQILAYQPENEQEAGDKRVILDYIETFGENILLRTNEFAHLTSSGLIMNPDFTKVLMIHHNIYNTWTWTGGHADGDTDLLGVALKEAREETGIVEVLPYDNQIASLDILPVWGHMKKGNYVSAHLHLNASYILIASESSKLLLNVEETSGIQWIKVHEIRKYSNEPAIIEVYNKLISKAKK